jgi:hypothetical protein
MWIAMRADIPEGMFICHRCDNRRCIAIEHLFIGTRADNVADMVAKGRRKNVGGKRGELHWKAKLTEERVREIRAHGGNYRTVATVFGLDPHHAFDILSKRIWKHV